MNRADSYIDWALVRQIELQQVGSDLLEQIALFLKEFETQIVAAIVEADPTGVERLTSRENRLTKLLENIRSKIKEVNRELDERIGDWFTEIADKQEDDDRKKLLLIYGLSFDKIAFDVTGMLILGSSLEQWVDGLTTDLEFRLRALLQTGVQDGQPLEEIIALLRGSADELEPGLLDKTLRQAETVLRTGLDTLPNEITLEILDENRPSSVRYGWQHISVLDSRTTTICRERAFKVWDRDYKPIGHSIPFDGGPPLHPNCRSRVVMILLDDERATRHSFAEWMATKTEAELSELFGAENVRLWRQQRITDTALIRRAKKKPLDDFLGGN